MRALGLAVVCVVALGLVGCGSDDREAVMPDVMGQRLDVALSDIERAGIDDEVEVLGGGLFGVVDESNWEVCDQSPAAGEVVSVAPRLTVERSCGEEPTEPEDEAESVSPSEEPAEGTEAEAEVLTAENNEEFAALLTIGDPCSTAVADFAATYADRTVRFDGSIVAMGNHADYNTRYNVLLAPEDYSETAGAFGPAFQFRDVNIFELHLTGPDIPDTVGVGDNLRITARIDEFESKSCLFLLDPVSTEIR